MELGPMNGQTSGSYNSAPTQNRQILDECRNIEGSIDSVTRRLGTVRELQDVAFNSTDSSPNSSANRNLEDFTTETMAIYRNLGARIKTIKQSKESGSPLNKNQVGLVDRKLRAAINEFQQLDTNYRKRLSEQMERQYRIVRPDASEQEVREAVSDTSNNQIFSQAVSVNSYSLPLPLLTHVAA